MLVVQEENDDGRVKVWSTDSEDDEIRKPTHGGYFVLKSEKEGYASKCLMVQSGNSKPKGYATDGRKASESYFAAKTIMEQVKE